MFPIQIAPYAGHGFWLILSLFIFLHWLINLLGHRPVLRNLFMILISYFVISSVTHNQYLILSLLMIAVLVYLTGRFIVLNPGSNLKININIEVIALLVFVLCYFKYSFFQSSINSIFQQSWEALEGIEGPGKHIVFLGVSYFIFKFIHFLIECYNKKIKHLSLLTFINYTLFFPSFFSGPINRFNFFSENIHNENKAILFSDYIEGMKRIINGLFKKVVLANNLLPYTISVLDFSDPSLTPAKAILGVYAYMFFIYFDFSGYTDMAIGSARLVGMDLPENFNYPFLKRNLQQFWANWHMSLTTWLTDYIYWPLARRFRRIKRLRQRPVTTSNICIICTFFVCGAWHGDGLNFVLWGLYHGIGLAILNIYTHIVKKYFSLKWKKAVNKSKSGYAISTFVTFQYVAFGFLLFSCDMERQFAFFRLFG